MIKKTIWIVSGRINTDVLYPRVCMNEEDAENEAKEIILTSARNSYYDLAASCEDSEELGWDEISDWADSERFDFDYYDRRGVFYDGSEYTEVEITEHEIEI